MPPVDADKLRHHIDHVRGNLRRLRDIAAQGREAFLASDITINATVRYLQTSIEAVIDIVISAMTDRYFAPDRDADRPEKS